MSYFLFQYKGIRSICYIYLKPKCCMSNVSQFKKSKKSVEFCFLSASLFLSSSLWEGSWSCESNLLVWVSSPDLISKSAFKKYSLILTVLLSVCAMFCTQVLGPSLPFLCVALGGVLCVVKYIAFFRYCLLFLSLGVDLWSIVDRCY